MSELIDAFLTLVLVRVWPVNVSSCEPSKMSLIFSPAATVERRGEREEDETDREIATQTHVRDVEMEQNCLLGECRGSRAVLPACAEPGWLWKLLEAFHTPFLLLWQLPCSILLTECLF